MKIEDAEVARIAALAHLEIDPAEAQRMAADMRAILGHADRLEAVADEPGDDARKADVTPAAPAAPEAAAPGTAAPETAGGDPDVGGVRSVGAVDGPDPLSRGPEVWAPSWAEGFFVVPPPPGVQADASEGGS